jgi:PPM family protein phosphatase
MSRVRASFGDIYVVSDGMGGHKAGATAAELTASVLQERLRAKSRMPSKEEIKEAFDAANADVYKRGHAGEPSSEGMGATAVVLLTAGTRALVAHLGDSRAYLHRRGRLSRLTKDHTRVQRMVDARMLSEREALLHPDAGVLEKAIGQSAKVDAEIGQWFHVKEGDEILLCSDGLCGYVEDAQIETALSGRGSAQDFADRLVSLALGKGGKDNITVQLVRYGERSRPRNWRVLAYAAALVPTSVALSVAIAYLNSAHLQQSTRGEILALQKRLIELEERNNALQLVHDRERQQISELEGRIAQIVNTVGKVQHPAIAGDEKAAAQANEVPANKPKAVLPRPSTKAPANTRYTQPEPKQPVPPPTPASAQEVAPTATAPDGKASTPASPTIESAAGGPATHPAGVPTAPAAASGETPPPRSAEAQNSKPESSEGTTVEPRNGASGGGESAQSSGGAQP